jgi:hypothetical protein
MGLPSSSTAGIIGTILCRVVVPLWILTGVTFKLISGTPSTLPTLFVKFAQETNIDLGLLLYTLVSLEIFAVGVMVFLPRFARAMAMFMLTSFCVILVGEILRNAESCGCLGAVTVKPWQMLLIDGILLVGVAVFAPTRGERVATSLAKPAMIAAAMLVAGFGISFGAAAMTPDTVEPPPVVNGDDDGGGDVDPTSPLPLPKFWYVKDIDAWAGTPWRELEIFRFMKDLPTVPDQGTHYVVFYRRTCDHCEDMFLEHFTDPGIASSVTAVEVPESATVMTSPDAWEFVETDAEHRQLTLGCDWIVTTPLAIAIVDGKVTCAEEGEHVNCLGLE